MGLIIGSSYHRTLATPQLGGIALLTSAWAKALSCCQHRSYSTAGIISHALPMTQLSKRMCGGKFKLCAGDLSVYGPFHCSSDNRSRYLARRELELNWKHFTAPPTCSCQTSHSVFRLHLFHWSNYYRKREAEVPYGCMLLLQLPLG